MRLTIEGEVSNETSELDINQGKVGKRLEDLIVPKTRRLVPILPFRVPIPEKVQAKMAIELLEDANERAGRLRNIPLSPGRNIVVLMREFQVDGLIKRGSVVVDFADQQSIAQLHLMTCQLKYGLDQYRQGNKAVFGGGLSLSQYIDSLTRLI